ncbi:MAG: hypothetical protein ACFCVE_00655 [Phycisphaerae bacterium]
MYALKRILSAITMALAVNFLLLAGAAGYLWTSAGVDREKIDAMKAVLWPEPTAEDSAEASGEETEADGPIDQLTALLDAKSDLPDDYDAAGARTLTPEAVAELDRRRRELLDMRRQIEMARAQLAQQRAEIERREQALADRQALWTATARDEGFQQTLALYEGMSSKQVKELFMQLDDNTVISYLRAMEPRKAAKLVKEFKSPPEVERITRIMESMRLAQLDG